MVKKQRRRKDLEVRFFEGLVEEKPNFYEALSCLGNAYTRKGFYRQGLSVDKRICSLRPHDPVAFYNLACSYSLLGNLDEALKAFKKAVKLGYKDIAYALVDEDLQALRKDPRFKRFLAGLKRKNNAKK